MWRLQYHPPNTSVSIFHRHPRPPTPLSSHIMPGTGRLSGELQQSCQRAAGACAVVLPATAGQATVFWLKKRRSPVRLARGKLRRQRAGWSSRVHGGSASTSVRSFVGKETTNLSVTVQAAGCRRYAAGEPSFFRPRLLRSAAEAAGLISRFWKLTRLTILRSHVPKHPDCP